MKLVLKGTWLLVTRDSFLWNKNGGLRMMIRGGRRYYKFSINSKLFGAYFISWDCHKINALTETR